MDKYIISDNIECFQDITVGPDKLIEIAKDEANDRFEQNHNITNVQSAIEVLEEYEFTVIKVS